MAGKNGMKHYPTPIKAEAVRLHLKEGKTTSEVTELLGINDGRRIRKWCETYRKYGTYTIPPTKANGRARKRERTAQQQIEYEIKQLRMENELLRNFLYEVGRM